MTFKNLRRVTRIGVYAAVLQEQSILLIEKKSGCYKGLLDLPGGGIEFTESPEEALKRELLEEVALEFESMKWMANLSHNQEVTNVDNPFYFHQLGLIYEVLGHSKVENVIPEESFAWHSLKQIDLENLTPFARVVVEKRRSI
jgi:8-oxo-dGTP pyrophosphatase MutT (NUDIX family)